VTVLNDEEGGKPNSTLFVDPADGRQKRAYALGHIRAGKLQLKPKKTGEFDLYWVGDENDVVDALSRELWLLIQACRSILAVQRDRPAQQVYFPLPSDKNWKGETVFYLATLAAGEYGTTPPQGQIKGELIALETVKPPPLPPSSPLKVQLVKLLSKAELAALDERFKGVPQHMIPELLEADRKADIVRQTIIEVRMEPRELARRTGCLMKNLDAIIASGGRDVSEIINGKGQSTRPYWNKLQRVLRTALDHQAYERYRESRAQR
jgi:hypothetical protein